MQDKYLKKVQKNLPHYYTYFKHDNVLIVSEDKAVLPFAYIIANNIPEDNHLLLSIAVDYPFSERVCDVALIANKVRKIAITDQFFISQMGTTYIGQEAHKYFQIESELPLEHMTPPTDSMN